MQWKRSELAVKRLKRLVFLVLCMLLIAGCSGKDTTLQTDVVEDKNDSNNNTGTIKIYFWTPELGSYTDALSIFREKYPNCTIDIEDFASTTELSNNLTTELLAGEGPDVILFRHYMFKSINKVVKSGVFYDINKLIEKDKEFNLNDYNAKVMEAGVFDGKRYVIPLSYYVHAYLTSEEIIAQHGVDLDLKNCNIKQFADFLRKFMNEKKEGQAEYFFDIPVAFSNYVFFSGLETVDYDKSEVHFDTPEFRQLLNMYKDTLMHASVPGDLLMQKYEGRYWEMMEDNSTVASISIPVITPLYLYDSNSVINYYLGNKARLYPMPAFEVSGKCFAQAYQLAAINNNSRNKELAFGFIKVLMSREIQKTKAIYMAPVNEKAYNEMLDEYMTLSGERVRAGTRYISSIPLSEELANDSRSIASNIYKCVIPDWEVMEFIDQAAQKYFDGSYTEDQVIKELENKVMLYLNE